MNKRELELRLINVAERFPTRVGLRGSYRTANCLDHCIQGQILHDLGLCDGLTSFPDLLTASAISQGTMALAGEAATLNDEGVPWGEIPKRLGLVPGELQPEVEPQPEPELVEVS